MSDSPLVIRRRPQKAPTIFDHIVEFQSHCLDVTIYSQKAKQVVTIAWRGLHWSCFCGLTAPPGVHLSCQIIHASSSRVLAFCHYEPSTCKFFSMWFPLSSIAPQIHPFWKWTCLTFTCKWGPVLCMAYTSPYGCILYKNIKCSRCQSISICCKW